MWKDEKGASLVEIMVALLVFGLGITMVMRSVPEGSASITKSRNATIAMNLAQEKLEDLMSLPYDDFDLAAGNYSDNPLRDHFTRSWTIEGDKPIVEMKTLTVTVSFPAAGSDSVCTLRTFVSTRR